MVPYLLLDKAAPLPVAFANAGLEWAKWPVGIGAVCALTASLLGTFCALIDERGLESGLPEKITKISFKLIRFLKLATFRDKMTKNHRKLRMYVPTATRSHGHGRGWSNRSYFGSSSRKDKNSRYCNPFNVYPGRYFGCTF